jgi:hypothetical protein
VARLPCTGDASGGRGQLKSFADGIAANVGLYQLSQADVDAISAAANNAGPANVVTWSVRQSPVLPPHGRPSA